MKDSAQLLQRLRKTASEIAPKTVRIMEVCGTHTHVIGRAGLRSLLPPNVELISGPGCPVCVTSQADVERMLLLARNPSVTACTYGDMIRVPGLTSSLEQLRSAGANVQVVSSALAALDLAEKRPETAVVFFAAGFETSAPATAVVLQNAAAKRLANFFVLPLHKFIVPAMETILQDGADIQGFLTPGHVSVIIGAEAYEQAALQYNVPCVATGFEPLDIIEGVQMLLDLIHKRTPGSFVQYTRAVRPDGNRRARDFLDAVFEPADAEWRGLGVIPGSGTRLKKAYRRFDAQSRFDLPPVPNAEPEGCRCGDVLRGMIGPVECPLFGRSCTPRKPVGPCMVSSEGSCAARYRYG